MARLTLTNWDLFIHKTRHPSSHQEKYDVNKLQRIVDIEGNSLLHIAAKMDHVEGTKLTLVD